MSLPMDIRKQIEAGLRERYACDDAQVACIMVRWGGEAAEMYAKGAEVADIVQQMMLDYFDWEPGKAKRR